MHPYSFSHWAMEADHSVPPASFPPSLSPPSASPKICAMFTQPLFRQQGTGWIQAEVAFCSAEEKYCVIGGAATQTMMNNAE